MKKKYISLPKHHFSYSQWQLWIKDPARYRSLYFDGRADLNWSNRGQTFGKQVADALEMGQDTGDVLTDSAMLLLPKYDVQDQPIEVEVKTKHGWLNLLAKPDTYNSTTHEFIEFKTGKGHNPWTAKKAQDHLQMWFYAVVIWQKYGVVLDNALLAWMETEDTPEGIKPTGRIDTFTVHFSKAGLMDALARIIKSANEIQIAWASHETKEWITSF